MGVVQVGLLIGKLEVSSSRDSVFALVPTPAKDGEEAAKIAGAATGQKESSGKKNAKAKSAVDNTSVVVDTDWIAEHSRQVRRWIWVVCCWRGNEIWSIFPLQGICLVFVQLLIVVVMFAQVSRMLVGGMDVVGIFVFASEGALKNSTAVLWQVSVWCIITGDYCLYSLL